MPDTLYATPLLQRNLEPDALVRLPPTIPIATIIRETSRHFSVPLNAMLSNRRGLAEVNARHTAMLLSRDLTRHTITTIARAFDRDHTTTLVGIRRIERLRRADPALSRNISELWEHLRATADAS